MNFYYTPTILVVIFGSNMMFFGSLAAMTRESVPDIHSSAVGFLVLQIAGVVFCVAGAILTRRAAEQRDANLGSRIDAATDTLREYEQRLASARQVNAGLSSRLHATTLTNLSLTTKNKELQDELAIHRAQSSK